MPIARHPSSGAASQAIAIVGTRPVDPELERLVLSLAPGAHVVSAVAIDIDHDGDLDLVASTREDVLVVWINDGNGHFSEAVPVERPAFLNGRQAAVEGHTHDREPALGSAHTPCGAQPTARVTPAELAYCYSASDEGSSPVSSIFSVRTPRAPPSGSARRS